MQGNLVEIWYTLKYLKALKMMSWTHSPFKRSLSDTLYILFMESKTYFYIFNISSTFTSYSLWNNKRTIQLPSYIPCKHFQNQICDFYNPFNFLINFHQIMHPTLSLPQWNLFKRKTMPKMQYRKIIPRKQHLLLCIKNFIPKAINASSVIGLQQTFLKQTFCLQPIRILIDLDKKIPLTNSLHTGTHFYKLLLKMHLNFWSIVIICLKI